MATLTSALATAHDPTDGDTVATELRTPTPTTIYPRLRDTILPNSPHPFDFAALESELMGDRWVGADLADDPGAHVPTPARWLAAEPDDPELARQRWRYKLKTYERFDLNDLLDRPHPMFEVLQKCIRPLVLGMTHDGNAVVTMDDFTRVAWDEIRRLGITMEEMVYHYLWFSKFIYSGVVHPEMKCTLNLMIIDVARINLSYVRGDKKRLASVLGKFFETFEPETNLTTFIVNTPGWFNWVVWPIATVLLSKRALDKFNVVPNPMRNEKYVRKMENLTDMACIPEELGGTSDDVWSNKYQRGMHDHAATVCTHAGIKMLTEEDVLRMRKEIAAESEKGESKS
jgi:hypothetical protein